jgi:hypothetical protein
MWHDIYTKFHEDWYRQLSNIKVSIRNFRCSNVGITNGRD